eukprot:Rhum_TRINITY_DN14666_c4_g1::Rhum_TRINITY_DN14666_c4_g1_i1::g.107201::m.107201
MDFFLAFLCVRCALHYLEDSRLDGCVLQLLLFPRVVDLNAREGRVEVLEVTLLRRVELRPLRVEQREGALVLGDGGLVARQRLVPGLLGLGTLVAGRLGQGGLGAVQLVGEEGDVALQLLQGADGVLHRGEHAGVEGDNLGHVRVLLRGVLHVHAAQLRCVLARVLQILGQHGVCPALELACLRQVVGQLAHALRDVGAGLRVALQLVERVVQRVLHFPRVRLARLQVLGDLRVVLRVRLRHSGGCRSVLLLEHVEPALLRLLHSAAARARRRLGRLALRAHLVLLEVGRLRLAEGLQVVRVLAQVVHRHRRQELLEEALAVRQQVGVRQHDLLDVALHVLLGERGHHGARVVGAELVPEPEEVRVAPALLALRHPPLRVRLHVHRVDPVRQVEGGVGHRHPRVAHLELVLRLHAVLPAENAPLHTGRQALVACAAHGCRGGRGGSGSLRRRRRLRHCGSGGGLLVVGVVVAVGVRRGRRGCGGLGGRGVLRGVRGHAEGVFTVGHNVAVVAARRRLGGVFVVRSHLVSPSAVDPQ